MENRFWKQNRNQLIFIAAVVVLICLIAMAFFRTDIFVDGIRTIIFVLTPFIYGYVIAYLLRPACMNIEKFLLKITKNKKPGLVRMIAAAVSMIVMLALVIYLLLLVLPELINSITNIVSGLPGAIERFQTWLSGMDSGETSHEVVGYTNEIVMTLYKKLQDFLQTSLIPNLESTITQVTSSFMGLIDVLKNFGLGCIISLYFLTGWEKFAMQIRMVLYSIIPRKAADWVGGEARYTDQMFSGFIIGKIVDSAIIGVICFVFCSITRMPYALLISVIVGVTNVIPFFGPYLGAIPSVLLILTESTSDALLFLIFIIVLQQVDGNVIGPRIIGNKLGLSSFWILFAILFFGALWGLIGMLVGVPLFAVLYDLIRKGISYGLKKQNCSQLEEEYAEKYRK